MFFFFKQKTAYEMRISDWSSDVVLFRSALAEGRDQGRAVRRYLEALEAHKPRRGRKRTPDSIKRRLTAVDTEYASADPLKRLHLEIGRASCRERVCLYV